MSWNVNRIKRNNNKLFPKSIRAIIFGKSGCVKTTLLPNLLLRPGWLDYNNLQVFGKSLFQPECKILKSSFEKKLPKKVIFDLFNIQSKIEKLNSSPECVIDEISKKWVNKEDMECQFFETAEDVPEPEILMHLETI